MSSTVKLKRVLLEPVARAQGLHYDLQMLEPAGTTDASRAYLLLTVGADLLLQLTDPDRFPSVEKRVRKKGARRVARHILVE